MKRSIQKGILVLYILNTVFSNTLFAQTGTGMNATGTQIPQTTIPTSFFTTGGNQSGSQVPWDELYTPENFLDGNFDPDKALEAVKALTAGITSIENQLKDIETRIDMNDINYQKTKDEIVIVLQDIRDTNTNMIKRLKRLQTYKKFAEYAKDQLRTLKNEIAESKAYIIKFTQFLYKLNNELYDENFKLDEIKLFLKSENIAQSLSQEAMMETLVKKLNELVGEMDKKQTTLVKLIQRINRLKAESIIEIEEHKTQFENLVQKRRYLQEFLELYKLEKVKFQGEIKNLFDTRKDVQKEFLTLSQEINNGKYNVGFDMGEAINALVSLPQYSRREHALFAWPVLPVKNFGALFKDKTYQEKYGIENLGVELITPQMSPVYAAQDGIVVKVVDADGITLNRVALLHTNGYMSQYAYMNKVIVKEGTIVRRGELLGYSGGEPGTRGAGFIASQPHISFEITKNGKHVDPLSVLDLSIFKDKTIIPLKYEMKYRRDQYGREINLSEVKFMPGDTVLQRRINFLRTYGVGVFRHLVFREDAASETNIDPDIGICIGFAESTMGKNLSTDNNIGNVGNNDRGDRVAMNTALGGARAIYDTLNNEFLRKYHRLDELSGRGNKVSHIYASSEFNRQNNVLRCLTMIKGYYVPEEYPFRIGPSPLATSYSGSTEQTMIFNTYDADNR